MNSDVNCGLRVTMMCQCRFIGCRMFILGQRVHVWGLRARGNPVYFPFFFSNFFVFYLIFIEFFPITFSSPYTSLPPAVTLLSMSMSPFSFLLNLSTPNPPPAVTPLSIYESVPIFLVCSVCSLESTHEWEHTVFVFLWRAYVTEHDVLLTEAKLFFLFMAEY